MEFFDFYPVNQLFNLALAYQLGLMLITEFFPMKTQAICAGIIEAIAQIGSFLGPIIITISIDLQVYPVIILSFIGAATCMIPIYFLKVKKE